MAKRLTSHHPLSKKVEKIAELMDELGVSVDWNGHALVVSDDETDAIVQDTDGDQNIFSFPPQFEFNLILAE